VTVKIYVSRDSAGQPWPPDYSHEVLATIDIIKRLWLAFNHHQENLYAIVANLHRPSADLVIISERGLGIVELKHYYGDISQRGGLWYAGPNKRIRSGSADQGYRNPHQQVQAYAEWIRDDIILSRQPLVWQAADWEKFKFQTAVCFTHPDVHIEDFKNTLRYHTRGWEEFSVLKPEAIPEWTAALRFESDMGREHRYQSHCLAPEQIIHIATQFLDGTEWTEIIKLMPTGEAYAYLTLIEQGRRVQNFGLYQEKVSLGRDANNCAVPIPRQYAYVGRSHAHITRSVQGIFIKDMDSKNGTYVDGQILQEGESKHLEHDQKITLGGTEPNDKVCLFEFRLKRPIEPAITETYTK